MESWRASMIPTTGDSLGGNGFVAIANSDLNPRTLSSSTRNHRYSCLKGKTAFQFVQELEYRPILLPPRFKLPEIDYIPEGTISLIRFIRSDQVLDIFGEHFKVPKEFIYSYVRAKIITGLHQIQIYSREDLLITLPYQLPDWITTGS